VRQVQDKPKQRRKVGRPISYCGDPDSPDLTPSERRRILRRIANRESARRVRSRRQELLEDLSNQVHSPPHLSSCFCAGILALLCTAAEKTAELAGLRDARVSSRLQAEGAAYQDSMS
jgi:hypothetical protein